MLTFRALALRYSLRQRANARNVSTSLLSYGGITYLISSSDYPNFSCSLQEFVQHCFISKQLVVLNECHICFGSTFSFHFVIVRRDGTRLYFWFPLTKNILLLFLKECLRCT